MYDNERSDTEIKETIPFTIALKRIKYLGINPPKETKDLYSENYKMLIKAIEDKQVEIYTMFLDWKNQYCKNDHTSQGNLQVQFNPCQTTNGIFHITGTKTFKLYIETQKTPNSKSNLEKEKWS